MGTRKKVTPTRYATREPRMNAARSVNVPAYTHRVNAVMYEAMRKVMMKVLPRKAPGMTQAEMIDALAAAAPKSLFPTKGRVAWWMKTVQLDLEAKKVVLREKVRPLRWHRAK